MQQPLKVTLSDEDSERLKNEVFAIISEAVRQAKHNATQAGEWFKGRQAVAGYLSIGTDTVSKMVALGLPEHHIGAAPNINLYKKSEVDEFILNDGYLSKNNEPPSREQTIIRGC
ncbi:hypothetical protein [Lentilactobacillus kosonis]|uniref:Uncharacterized protein n=1 Tax=Lentilactobacillus kosonis TaxID=2810561 RepID=A0A401FJC0_9LACO|nr:hypothetical protein [Lentilactobacillus kosonis]GAY72449.1 hypothetical protein NBRC111893_595 [Lentilactobacillus kosonis]